MPKWPMHCVRWRTSAARPPLPSPCTLTLSRPATWRWNHGDTGGEGLLRRVAGENLILVSSGGSDWLPSSGSIVKDEGGFRVNARKIFSSGSPSGDLLVTSAVLNDAAEGPAVLHFPISLRADGVKILDNWRALGMRGTGSHDVVIERLRPRVRGRG
jgi:alkylation response protein AidB-like acyl-CoA dehydrogenase